MLLGAATIAGLLIIGLFFEMIGSPPRRDSEWNSDTKR